MKKWADFSPPRGFRLNAPWLSEKRRAQNVDGADLLAGASLEFAPKWRFAPNTLDGKPVRVMGILTFNFTLQ